MRITIDSDARTLETNDGTQTTRHDLYSPEAFEIISREWLSVGWCLKYTYSFTWMGRPVIQLPEDMIRLQEVIYSLRPDVIIETGVAHGGSLIYYASLCKAMEHGRIIGIDIEIRPHNRSAIEAHPLSPWITLVEGSSIDPAIVAKVQNQIKAGEKTLILLDSNHSKDHVLAELVAYGELVTPGSYIVATDGIMADVADRPRGVKEWATDNPSEAAREFVARDSRFRLEEPPFAFNEGEITRRVTCWPTAWIRRVA